MNEFESEDERDFELLDIERLINIPIVSPDELLHEILTELKRIQRDGDGGGNKAVKTKLDYRKPKHPIAEYISFRDRVNDNTWGVVIHARPLLDLVIAAMNSKGVSPGVTVQNLCNYFTQRETFHFYVDRAIFGIENVFKLHTGINHDLWKKQCGKRLYQYSKHEETAAEYFSLNAKNLGATSVFNFLSTTGHVSKSSMNIQSAYGTHRELNSWVLSDYLNSGCLIDDRIVGIENLLGLDNDGLGGVTSIKLSETDKRKKPTELPVRLAR